MSGSSRWESKGFVMLLRVAAFMFCFGGFGVQGEGFGIGLVCNSGGFMLCYYVLQAMAFGIDLVCNSGDFYDGFWEWFW
jgi:hypothetical protein